LEETINSIVRGRAIVDDHRFERCTFRDAELVYTGGTPPALIDCSFENARLVFEGPADSTVQYLRALAGGAPQFRAAVLALIPDLNTPAVAQPAND
jgi:hypothetical protein